MVHLLSLPLEILGIICSNFCRHCTHEPKEPELREPGQPAEPIGLDDTCFKGADCYLADKTGAKNATLSAMAQTCKALRDIAQPYICHHPAIYDPEVYKLLHRTLVERPHFAQYIKELSAFDMTLADVTTIPDLATEKKLFQRTFQDNPYRKPPPNLEKRVKIEYNTKILFTTLILPFGISLQTLHFVLDEDCKFPTCAPGSLPRLKELVVNNKWNRQEAFKVISSLLIAAPALERLGGIRFSGPDWKGPQPPIHEGVKEVLLERCVLGPKVFTTLLNLFPRLEAFTYESYSYPPDGRSLGFDSDASVSEIGEALLACPDLRFLSLDFTSSRPSNNPTDHLAGLKKLQKFRFKGLSPHDPPEKHRFPRKTPLVKMCDMLPDSITELEVTYPNTSIFNAMVELSAVASQRFPLLKQVSITGIEQEWEIGDWRVHACMGLARINELREAFRQSGIELLAGDFGKFRSWVI
ncbi:hypothetical protein CDV31_001471 [Fusarium ambrosium]|uniref:F-box domain-containing protein n=1 Tax=Fusarium ambrosium TaxID=131363 RepID=A0A428UZ63_9HYPO|nr:hypothetical protein CDV31_001471 [Fusarium ambrosium]